MSIEHEFPNLAATGYRVTSPPSPEYNCIAWAVGEQDRWWWPDAMGVCFWPSDVPREETLPAFIRAFELAGYSAADNAEFEIGFLKLAIYAQNGEPTHAARQLSNGRWTSKLGANMDVEHSLDGLAGDLYGTVEVILKLAVS